MGEGNIVFEYSTINEFGYDGITGWNAYNVIVNPEKEVFRKNSPPTPEMNEIGGLFDEDGIPKYALRDSGIIERVIVPEEVRVLNYNVMQTRFKRKYPKEVMDELQTLKLLEDKADKHPKLIEFKNDYDALQALLE